MGGRMGSGRGFATVQDRATVSTVSSGLPQNTSWVVSPAWGRPIPSTSHRTRTQSSRWPFWPPSISMAILISRSMSSYRTTPSKFAGWQVMLRGERVTYSLAVCISWRLPPLNLSLPGGLLRGFLTGEARIFGDGLQRSFCSVFLWDLLPGLLAGEARLFGDGLQRSFCSLFLGLLSLFLWQGGCDLDLECEPAIYS